MLKPFQICRPKEDLANSKNGQIIGKDSDVVILSIEGTKALVCRKGNYLDNLRTELNLLTGTGK